MSTRWPAPDRLRRVLVLLATAAGTVVLAATSAAGQQSTAPARTGQAIYAASCQQCHGVDGRGGLDQRLGLAVPTPDFTVCRFGPREADLDWTSVITNGGPARGFHRQMPAFGDALTEEEIALALSHVRAFCSETSWPRGELNLPKAIATEKAFPEDEVLITTSFNTEGDASTKTKFVYEKRFGARNQIEVVVPVSSHSTGGNWSSGFNDMAFAYKRVLVANPRTGTIMSVTGELVLPTASATDGWGSGHATLEPFVTLGQILPADGFLQFQGGLALPQDSDAAKESFYRFVLGKTFTRNRFEREFSPMVEVLGAREHAAGQKTQWDILPEMQITLSTRKHIRTNIGFRMPLTDRGPRKSQFLVYFLWDWYDGGLFQGW